MHGVYQKKEEEQRAWKELKKALITEEETRAFKR